MSELLNVAVETARAAGQLLLPFFERRVRIEYKGDVDLVTEADRASEKLIVERIRSHFPDHSILAEEGTGSELQPEYRWYVDPLDGTTNFAHGFPVWCVSIGVERAGELVAGVVFDATRNELFTAEKGQGAFLNGKPIHVSKTPELAASLVATGFPTQKRHKSANIHFYYQVNMRSHGVRRAGSAALDLCSVAAGRMEAFWEFGLNPWDVAAGKVLIEEAGGRLTDMKGEPHSLRSPHLLASNGLVHNALLQVFDEIFRGDYVYPLPEISKP